MRLFGFVHTTEHCVPCSLLGSERQVDGICEQHTIARRALYFEDGLLECLDGRGLMSPGRLESDRV